MITASCLEGRQFRANGESFGGATGGPRRASADLFDGATWFLTPTSATAAESLAKVERFVAAAVERNGHRVRGIEPAAMKPTQGRRRVFVFRDAERMNDQAQNALLKTLEEAPEKVILLLTADAPENLLPTITSRCEILRLRPIGVADLAAALQTRWGQPQQAAQRLAHLAGGRVGIALSMIDDPALLERRGARIAFVVTAGFEDLLWLRRQERAGLYDLARDHQLLVGDQLDAVQLGELLGAARDQATSSVIACGTSPDPTAWWRNVSPALTTAAKNCQAS